MYNGSSGFGRTWINEAFESHRFQHYPALQKAEQDWAWDEDSLFLTDVTWCATASRCPLLSVCVLVVHHRRSPPNPYRPPLAPPSPWLPRTSGREKSPAVSPRNADSRLCPLLPLPSRPTRERGRERVWKCEERWWESRWNAGPGMNEWGGGEKHRKG